MSQRAKFLEQMRARMEEMDHEQAELKKEDDQEENQESANSKKQVSGVKAGQKQ